MGPADDSRIRISLRNLTHCGVPADVRAGLSQRGHQIKLLEPFSFFVGQGAAVVRDSSRNVNFAAGDPRSDGAAIPQEPNTR